LHRDGLDNYARVFRPGILGKIVLRWRMARAGKTNRFFLLLIFV